MKKGRRLGLVVQLDLLLLVSLAIVGTVTYFSQYRIEQGDRKKVIGILAKEVSDEMIAALKEYPAYRWLLSYWYENAAQLDIEYDADFSRGTKTEEKCRLLTGRNPGLQIKYARTSDIAALGEEDQKLYAEIVYSWLVTRVDQIKQCYHVDYLYFMLTQTEASEKPYSTQVFLLSGADPGQKRGTQMHDVFPAGTVVDTEKNLINVRAMKDAVESARGQSKNEKRLTVLDDSGSYIDAYAFVDWIGIYPVLAGMSFNTQKVMRDISRQTWESTWYAMFYEFLLLQIVLLLMYCFGIRPLGEIARNIRFFSMTKDGDKVRTNLQHLLSGTKAAGLRYNEIGQLTEDFIDLTVEIDDHVKMIRTMTAERERIEVELNLAADIQADMLPSVFPAFPDRTEFDLYALMNPAREVGGDFYDFFLVDDDHLAMVIADVSGKGVPAALFMMIAKTLIKNHAQAGDSPKTILEHVNRQLIQDNEKGYFVTTWLAIVEISTGRGVAANAGHEHPALYRPGSVFKLVRYRHDPALAMLPGTVFTEHEFLLYPGDRLFVYTDGVAESMNTQKETFGTDRMIRALNEDPEVPLKELLLRLRREIDIFCAGAEQFDDITMLCFWYKGCEQNQ